MGGIVSLAQALVESGKRREARAYLVPVLESGDTDELRDFEFQFWPDTVQDDIEVEWVDKPIPGGTHPLKQWVMTNGRQISFSAVFSRDLRVREELDKPFKNMVDNDRNKKYSRDIRGAVSRLRAFCYPEYREIDGVLVAQAPPTAELWLEGLALGHDGGDMVHVVMTQCGVAYERAFESGVPRAATVQLAFSEIAQRGGEVSFHDRRDLVDSPWYDRY